MIIEIILALFIGLICGIITGLTPGIHINLISAFIISLTLLTKLKPETLIVFLVSMSITHTFLDSIPSIFLGAPDSDHALSVLPGHKLLLQQKGYEAVLLTIIGSFSAILISICFIPLIYLILNNFYSVIQKFIPFFLISTLVFLILNERKNKITAFFISLLAGSLGLTTLSLNIEQILFPLFSGLFGISTLVISLKQKIKIPKQKITFPKIKLKKYIKTIFSGFIASLLVGTMPGLGSAQGAAIVESVNKKINNKYYLILTGSLNTFVMVISFVTLYTIGKARNGTVIAISKLVENYSKIYFIYSLITILAIAGIATILAINISKIFSKIIFKINYKKLLISIILLITILTVYLTNFIGLIVLLTSSFLGIYVNLKGIARSHLMSVLIIPVIFYFLI